MSLSKRNLVPLLLTLLPLFWLATGLQAQEVAVPAEGSTIKAAGEAGADSEMQNKRMQTLEGSKSAWSGQFQLQYTGSSLNHPFSSEAPNPGHLVPPPLVTMAGTFSSRYRINDKTTAGIGTGITTQTPFQGPKNSTLADPYCDIARSFRLGILHSRFDAMYTQFTNHQYYNDYGYREGFTFVDESFVETSFHLTVGLALQMDANIFAKGQYDESQQTVWDIAADPYFEYALTDTINLRSVVGIINYKNKDLVGTDRFSHPKVYQTFGLGVAATRSFYIYAFAQAFPYSQKHMAMDNTNFGFSTIINLF